jgi:transposase-like protein
VIATAAERPPGASTIGVTAISTTRSALGSDRRSSRFARFYALADTPDSEVLARHARRRFTTAYKLAILRRADACTRHGELGALLRKEGLYSSHVVTWRQQREAGLTPKKRGRKLTAVDPQLKKLEQENRRLTSRLQKAEALLAFQKKVSELLQIPLKPFVSDEDD